MSRKRRTLGEALEANVTLAALRAPVRGPSWPRSSKRPRGLFSFEGCLSEGSQWTWDGPAALDPLLLSAEQVAGLLQSRSGRFGGCSAPEEWSPQ